MDPMTQGQLKEWFLMFVTFGMLGWFAYLALSMLRRKQKNDMQRALLEKFSSAHDFAEFMQSPAGQKYVLSLTDEVTNPLSSVLNAVKIGIVMFFSGPGLVAAAQRYDLWFLYALGLFLMLGGIGFLVSAVISYFLLKKIRSAETKSATKD
jgi:predicted phage tail protein